MRLRLPELLVQHGMTAYQLAALSGGRISLSAAYRLRGSGGAFGSVNSDVLEALCDIFKVGPGDLFTRQPAPPRRRRNP